tara:strand:- start:29 stop:727 length:699 start_codon:yes stop_codon:yes gene_type:complete
MPLIDDKLDAIAREFADKVNLAVKDMTNILQEAIKGKKSAEALEILSGINIDKAYELKLANAFTAYEAGVVELLRSTYTTATIPEATIRRLLNASKITVMKNMGSISNTTMQSIMDGIASGLSVEDTAELIRGQLVNPEKVVRTAYNQFNNTMTTILADELPPDTKWIYIGANDEKTRQRCKDKIAFSGSSGKTQEEIVDKYGNMNNEIWECRHQWEQRSSSPLDQGFQKGE